MNATILNVLALLVAGVAGASTPRTFAAAVGEQGRVVLQMVDRHGFAMVEGRVNGRDGLFMLDTGTPFSAFLNVDYLRLRPGREVSRGSASSGQKITVLRQQCLNDLSIGGRYTLASLCGLNGADLRFVADGVDPTFLGFLGYEVFKPYRVTFDYAAHQVVLSDRARALEPGALAVLRFSAENRQVPSLTVTAGGLDISTKMDTGDQGHVNLTKGDADRLLASGKLIDLTANHGNLERRFVLTSVVYGGVPLDTADLPVAVSDQPSEIMLGFQFLRKYRSEWDYGDHAVRLYARGRRGS